MFIEQHFQEKGITQVDLASLLGSHQATVSRLYTRSRNVQLGRLLFVFTLAEHELSEVMLERWESRILDGYVAAITRARELLTADTEESPQRASCRINVGQLAYLWSFFEEPEAWAVDAADEMANGSNKGMGGLREPDAARRARLEACAQRASERASRRLGRDQVEFKSVECFLSLSRAWGDAWRVCLDAIPIHRSRD
jgi:hypothetical protein